MNKNIKKNEIIFNRKWVLILGLFFVFFGLENAITLIIGILTLMIGLVLFFTDSWGIYLIIFLLWLFGGIMSFLFSPMSNLTGWVGSLLVIFFGLGALADLGVSRRHKVKGHF